MVLEVPRQTCQCELNSQSLLPRGGRSVNGEDRSVVEVLGQQLRWPERGYGAHLRLQIYVYDVEEIQGLRELVSGRDHSIASSACAKGQWGTQVLLILLYIDLD